MLQLTLYAAYGSKLGNETVRLQAYTLLTCNAAAEALLLAKGGHELAALVDAQGNTAAHLKALQAQS